MMEYHEDFLNNWYPELSPASRGITRAEILERYTAKLGDNERRKQKYINDVIEIHLALDDKDRAQFIKERAAFGYRVTTEPSQTVCEGPDIKYIVTPRTSSSVGITAIKLSLRRAKPGEKVYRFGKRSVLRFNDDKTATWSF
jgi:phosphoribosyl-ATP pyrophosphohydrolase